MPRRAALLPILGLVLWSVLGCAGAASGGSPPNPNLITAEELARPAIETLSVYDAIQRLRPNWLRERGATSVMAGEDRLPAVMINEAWQNVQALQTVKAADVAMLRYVDARDATTRYGTGYVNGIIQVTMAPLLRQ
jgi:hypothetical protein